MFVWWIKIFIIIIIIIIAITVKVPATNITGNLRTL